MLAVCQVFMANSQEKEPSEKFGITFSGFVKNDFFWDSRQTVSAREGHFLLWPSAKSPDALGNDVNEKSNLNMLSIQSRLKGSISGPDAFGAKTSGVIEGDFFAQANDNINLLRLRHAFLKLSWENTELITGQYWNPLFVTGCYPGTVSFNTGTPFQSFARNPQIRITQSLGSFKVIGALLSQRDFASRGPEGVTSSYLRNSGMPDMHLQLQYTTTNSQSGNSLFAGVGVAYKTLVPRLSSAPAVDVTYQVDESVSSMAAIAYTAIKLSPITIKLQGRYGENIPDVLTISGFAVKEITNATTGEQSYTPLKNSSFWADIQTNGSTFNVGVFAGVLNNLGTKESMSSASNSVYGLGTNIESLVRISPRAVLNSGKVRFAFELEYTSAAYGRDYNVNYMPSETTTVANIRTLFSTYYMF